MANEEEAAIAFSGRTSRKGLLPSPGPLTRTAEGGDVCSAAAVVGVTLREAGFLGAPFIVLLALGECAGLGLARGGAFRATRPVEPLRSGLASGVLEAGKDRVAIAEDGAVGPTRLAESSARARRDCADGLSGRDAAEAGAG
jgi:hypothetical protein